MSHAVTAVERLFQSVYNLFAAVLSTAYNIVATVVNTVLNLFSGVINLITSFFANIVSILGDAGSFLLGNIVILALLAVGFFLYRQNQQGKSVTGGAKKIQ